MSTIKPQGVCGCGACGGGSAHPAEQGLRLGGRSGPLSERYPHRGVQVARGPVCTAEEQLPRRSIARVLPMAHAPSQSVGVLQFAGSRDRGIVLTPQIRGLASSISAGGSPNDRCRYDQESELIEGGSETIKCKVPCTVTTDYSGRWPRDTTTCPRIAYEQINECHKASKVWQSISQRIEDAKSRFRQCLGDCARPRERCQVHYRYAESRGGRGTEPDPETISGIVPWHYSGRRPHTDGICQRGILLEKAYCIYEWIVVYPDFFILKFCECV